MGMFTQGFSSRNNTPSVDTSVQPTLESMMSIVQESYEMAYAMEAGLYIGDTMIEAQVMEGAALEPLMEGFVGGVFTKMKELWMKIWKKVKSWFTAIINKFKAMTLSGEKFIAEFGDTLRKKPKAGFKYTGHRWSFDAFYKAIDEIANKINDSNDSIFGAFGEVVKKASEGGSFSSVPDKKELDKMVEKGIKESFKPYGSSFSTSTEKLSKVAKGEKGSVEIENFSAIPVDTMIDVVKNGKSEIARINRDMSESDQGFQEIIDGIDEANSKLSSESKRDDNMSEKDYNELLGKATGFLSSASSGMQQVKSTANSLHGLKAKLYEQYYKECQSVLKKFLSYKATKESADYDVPEGSESVFEAAMRFI